MRAALGRRQALPYPTSICDQSNAIAGIQSYLCQTQSRIRCIVQFAEFTDARTHKTAGVDDDPDYLATLDLINARDQLPAACGGGPADIAVFIAFAIFTQAVELAPNAPDTGMTLFHLNLAAAH